MKKINILLLVSFLSINFAWAECGQLGEIPEQQFEILQNKPGETSCVGGKVPVPGCILRLRKTDSVSEASKEYNVFAPEEICDWKKNDIKTIEIGTSCCDTLEVSKCSQLTNEVLKKDGIPKNACSAGVRYFVKKFRISKKAQEEIRAYNEQTKSFEVVAPKK